MTTLENTNDSSPTEQGTALTEKNAPIKLSEKSELTNTPNHGTDTAGNTDIDSKNTSNKKVANSNQPVVDTKDADIKAVADLRIALAQSTFVVGDIEANCQKVIEQSKEAKKQGADIVVFPELSLTGYPPEDLLLRQSLASRIQTAFKKLTAVKDILIIVGYPHIDHHGCFNSAAIFYNGKKRGFYHKQHLPNYGVFDEKRYFQAGKNHVSFDYKGKKIGVLICEDVWLPEPIQVLKQADVDLVITLNASPFETNKQEQRKQIIKDRCSESGLPIIYVNTVGGQDDLVFDGGSMVINSDGSIPFELNRFIEKLAIVDFKDKSFTSTNTPLTLSEDAQNYYALVIALRDYVKHSGFKSVLIGLSGGIDSALTLCIAVDALGAENVYAVMMPYEYTSEISLEDAQKQAKRLGVSYTVAPIHAVYQSMIQTMSPLFGNKKADTTEENIQARIRGMMLMSLSNKFGHMVITTGNKSEYAVGYATLYGDMCGGFAAIKDIYKSQVYQLARYRNQVDDKAVIPERVITRPPSAELRPDQVDQDSLPDYDILDGILALYIDEQKDADAIIKAGFDADTVKRVLKLVDRNEYKRRQAPIGAKIGKRAFNRERRYPIINGWLNGV